MESIVKPASLRRTVIGAILSIGLLTLGCSSDNSSPITKADAGKKDTGASGLGGSSGSGGSGGAGGSSGGTGGHDAGNAPVDGGGSMDAEASDAIDAPILNNDSAASDETGASSDGAVLIQIDTGAQDSEGVDSAAIDTTVVLLDAEAETSIVDAADDSAQSQQVDAGNCVQQIVSNGYSFAGAQACSLCKANDSDILSPDKCTAMIDCVETNWPACASGSCHLDCLHNVSGDGVVDTCVTNLVHASCGTGF
jgi:hypothetical protein